MKTMAKQAEYHSIRQIVPRRDNSQREGKVCNTQQILVAGHQDVGTGGMAAIQQHIVLWIAADLKALSRYNRQRARHKGRYARYQRLVLVVIDFT